MFADIGNVFRCVLEILAGETQSASTDYHFSARGNGHPVLEVATPFLLASQETWYLPLLHRPDIPEHHLH